LHTWETNKLNPYIFLPQSASTSIPFYHSYPLSETINSHQLLVAFAKVAYSLKKSFLLVGTKLSLLTFPPPPKISPTPSKPAASQPTQWAGEKGRKLDQLEPGTEKWLAWKTGN
jgi:hypothetical protein